LHTNLKKQQHIRPNKGWQNSGIYQRKSGQNSNQVHHHYHPHRQNTGKDKNQKGFR